jgi:CHAD domain-containing protein
MEATGSHPEIERKYDVEQDVAVPALHEVEGVGRVAEPDEVALEAVYYDTDDLALRAAGVTLRRRTGGGDAGWHLKLPVATDERDELRSPLADDVPPALLDRVRVHVRDREVSPVATIRTRRVVHRLLSPTGELLAELCDDLVTGESLVSGSPAGPQRWREWEVELHAGARELLDAVESVLLASGARPAAATSKLGRVAGDRGAPAQRHPVTKGSSAAEALAAYLDEHLSELKRQDMLLRAEDDSAVHKLRIAARRLRSALASYAPVLQPTPTDELRAELRWLGGVLAEPRDAQVLAKRLAEVVATQPVELVLGPVTRRIDGELGERYQAGRAEAVVAMNGDRYFRLLDRLDAFVTQPPFTAAASDPARRILPRVLQRDWKRVQKRAGLASAATETRQRELALHEIRKAAKRLRYAAESARPVLGKRAKKLAARAKAVQQVLGEHQDTVVARAALREIGVRAHLSGENGFTFGRLHAIEEARALRLVQQFPGLMAKFPKKLKRWLGG